MRENGEKSIGHEKHRKNGVVLKRGFEEEI